ncbi:hypothetical protein Efla_002047 [Eimeria flavescens]
MTGLCREPLPSGPLPVHSKPPLRGGPPEGPSSQGPFESFAGRGTRRLSASGCLGFKVCLVVGGDGFGRGAHDAVGVVSRPEEARRKAEREVKAVSLPPAEETIEGRQTGGTPVGGLQGFVEEVVRDERGQTFEFVALAAATKRKGRATHRQQLKKQQQQQNQQHKRRQQEQQQQHTEQQQQEGGSMVQQAAAATAAATPTAAAPAATAAAAAATTTAATGAATGAAAAATTTAATGAATGAAATTKAATRAAAAAAAAAAATATAATRAAAAAAAATTTAAIRAAAAAAAAGTDELTGKAEESALRKSRRTSNIRARWAAPKTNTAYRTARETATNLKI